MIACGIDIGSTNLKVVMADEDGRTLWVKSVPTPHVNDGLGTITDATALMALLEDLIIEGWRAVGGGEPLAAISSAGVGEDGVCADADMQSLGLVIAWHDKRALAEVARFRERFNFTRVDFHSTAGKWMWMRRHRAAEIGGAQDLDRAGRLSGSTLVRPALHERDAGGAHRMLRSREPMLERRGPGLRRGAAAAAPPEDRRGCGHGGTRDGCAMRVSCRPAR